MAIQIIDNFLPEKEFYYIQSILMSNHFPWFYHDYVSESSEQDKFYFNHNFYNDSQPQSDFFNLWKNTLYKLEVKSLIRVKGNLHVKAEQMTYNNFHSDLPFNHKGCIMYINNNNGCTYFKEGEKAVEPKENRIVLFDPNIEHKSSRCSDSKIRITINFNYF
tara:strand:+ start:72 stop:557 length:486 start_codon:yes stop_codon:yes gene_type:complete